MKVRLGITQKLTLAFVLFAVLILGGLGTLAYVNGRAGLEGAARSELLSTSLEKQAQINNWVDERLDRLSALAVTPSLIARLEALTAAPAGSPAAQAAHDLLVQDVLPRTGPGQAFLEVFVIEPETGQVIASTDPLQEGKYKEIQPFFLNGRNGPYVQNVYYSTALQEPIMTVSAPMRGGDGRRLGVLAGRLNLQEMDAILMQRTGLHQTDDAFLVNTANLFITQPRLLSDPAVLALGIRSEDVVRCLARSNGVISASDYRGVPSIIVYRWLVQRDVCLIVKMDRAEALLSVQAFGQMLVIFGGLVLAVASLLAFGLARTFTGPLQELAQGAAQIGQSNLDYQVTVKGGDELGQLADVFNQMAANLSGSRTDLEKANKELEAFSYSVSHDLRAPLRAIDGFSRILLEEYAENLPEDGKRYLNLVRSNTQQMGELVDDLLVFSRLGHQPLHKQAVAPADLARYALADLRSEQEGRTIDMQIGDLPACQGDPALLKQVFVNLLANALKYTRTREVAQVEIGFLPPSAPLLSQHDTLPSSFEAEIVYFVRDNGVGFDMRYANKLFGVFQRLHRAEEYEGTGVGLAVVQRIINRHGGRVWAEAELDKGATFFFSIGGQND